AGAACGYATGVGGSQVAAAGGVHGFPAVLTSFVGRAGAVREVAGLLGEFRLVMVTGPGGVGKTRLACAVAGRVAGRFADGAWLAELAPVRDPAQVPGVVAALLGVREQPGVPVGEAVARGVGRPPPLPGVGKWEHPPGAAAGAGGRGRGGAGWWAGRGRPAGSGWPRRGGPGPGGGRGPGRIGMTWLMPRGRRRWRCSPPGPAAPIRGSSSMSRPGRCWPRSRRGWTGCRW